MNTGPGSRQQTNTLVAIAWNPRPRETAPRPWPHGWTASSEWSLRRRCVRRTPPQRERRLIQFRTQTPATDTVLWPERAPLPPPKQHPGRPKPRVWAPVGNGFPRAREDACGRRQRVPPRASHLVPAAHAHAHAPSRSACAPAAMTPLRVRRGWEHGKDKAKRGAGESGESRRPGTRFWGVFRFLWAQGDTSTTPGQLGGCEHVPQPSQASLSSSARRA